MLNKNKKEKHYKVDIQETTLKRKIMPCLYHEDLILYNKATFSKTTKLTEKKHCNLIMKRNYLCIEHFGLFNLPGITCSYKLIN